MSVASPDRLADHLRDRLLAVGTAVFAASYVSAARGIENSLLSDAVGAGGVPQAVGIAMGLAAVALFIKSFSAAAKRAGPDEVVDGDEAAGDATSALAPSADSTSAVATSPGSVLLRSGALVLILIGYGLLLPLLGYALTISLLVLASGWLAGAALRAPLLACAAIAGPALWALFDKALQVRMPLGSLWT